MGKCCVKKGKKKTTDKGRARTSKNRRGGKDSLSNRSLRWGKGGGLDKRKLTKKTDGPVSGDSSDYQQRRKNKLVKKKRTTSKGKPLKSRWFQVSFPKHNRGRRSSNSSSKKREFKVKAFQKETTGGPIKD